MATLSPRPPRQRELLDQLIALFLAEGFRQFTLADLAERLRCSKSTLYAFGESKEQLTVSVIIEFFRRSALAIEEATAAETDPPARLVAYLRAVARALRSASAAFMADLGESTPTAAVYAQNTEAAAARVRALVEEGIAAGSFRSVHGAFVAEVVAATMRRIQTGELVAATGLRDADAYDALADLILNGVRS